MKRFKKLMLVLGLTSLLAACGSGNVIEKTEKKVDDLDEKVETKVEEKLDEKGLGDKDSDTNIAGLESKDTFLSLDEVAGAFYDNFGSTDIQIEKISLEEDDRVLVYNIEGFDEEKEYELELNAENGQIISQEVDSNDLNDDDYGIALDLIVTPAQAMEGALVTNEGTSVKEWKLEAEKNGIFYEVELYDDIEVKVNAETGEVIK
ncbi:PepSY domain-containing protein [Neofamilia massiliensis]|uniref:PepSY domain-containing protein n=1 Tax=Neofamilia massiliensis TaxID=1673724 RepID=UPI0006BB60BE|nr:PepSY domain-containing protein [Neofamilia massiliensis]